MVGGNDKRKRKLPGWFYYLVLVSATLIWGGNFVVSKTAVSVLHPTWVICIRFFSAGILLLAVMWPRTCKHMNLRLLKDGCIIGVFTFLGYWTQFLGLSGTTPSKNAFLSACYCVFVPFVWWVIARRKPKPSNLVGVAICVCGMALVSLKGDLSVSWGDGVSILSALLYGAEIAVIALLIKDHDVITLTGVQMVVGGICSGIVGLVTQTPFNADAFSQPGFLMALVYIIVLASCYASTAQNIAQTHIPPAQVGLLFALESIFATVFSVIFYNEVLSPRMVAGFLLIFVAILISELWDKRKGAEKR